MQLSTEKGMSLQNNNIMQIPTVLKRAKHWESFDQENKCHNPRIWNKQNNKTVSLVLNTCTKIVICYCHFFFNFFLTLVAIQVCFFQLDVEKWTCLHFKLFSYLNLCWRISSGIKRYGRTHSTWWYWGPTEEEIKAPRTGSAGPAQCDVIPHCKHFSLS